MTANAQAYVLELVECLKCGAELDREDAILGPDDEYYCEPCHEDLFVICERCEDTVHSDDATIVDGEVWCENCVDDHAVRCDACHELVPVDDAYIDRANTTICSYCYDNYFTCNSCEYIYAIEDGYEDDGFLYCEACWAERRGDEDDVIYAWNDGPPTKFFRSSDEVSHYYGIEIEVERGDSPLTRGEMAEKVLEVGMGHVYCKEDGSLECGFEVVSHAADYEYHLHKLPWGDILDCLREAGYRSHDARTCGFHIHISREAFGQDHETQLDRIHRLLYIVEKFWPYWLKFSRRTESAMKQWAARYLEDHEHPDHVPKEVLLDRAIYGSKYHAINLQKPKTIEVRMFRGTLKLSTLRATLQLVHYLVGLVTNDDIDLETITWEDIANDLRNLTPELKSYMEERGL